MKLPATPSGARRRRSVMRRLRRRAPQQAGAPAPTAKLPMRVAVMYGKALDMKDKGNKAGAVELFSAVLKEFPDYGPARSGAWPS